MKTNKRLTMWLLMIIMLLSLVGCGENEENNIDEDNGKQMETVKESDEKKDTDLIEDPVVEASEEEADIETTEETKQELTAKAIIDKMLEEYEGNTITYADVLMEMNMSFELQGMAVDMEMSVEGETRVSMEPYKTYTDFKMSMSAMGQNESVSAVSYTIEEDGRLYEYMNSDETGWTKVDVEMTIEDIQHALGTGFAWMQVKEDNEFSLEEQVYKLNGRDAYKVSLVLTGDEILQSLGNMYSTNELMATSGLEEIDMSQVNTPCSYYVDAETYHILKMEMDVSGIDKMLMDLLTEEYRSMEEVEELGIKIAMDKCRVVYDNVSYDPVEIPELPEEALAINESLSLDEFISGENDVYILEDSGNTVKVTCPEEWEVVESESNRISFANIEGTRNVSYCVFADVSTELMEEIVETTAIPEFQKYDGFLFYEKCNVGGYEAFVVHHSLWIAICAWIPVDDGMVYIVVTDSVITDAEESFLPFLEYVKW